MSIRSNAEKLLDQACVTDGPDGVCWVVGDEPVEALRDSLKEPTAPEVVAEINQDIWDALFEGKDETAENHDLVLSFSLTYSTDGNWEGIEFLGRNLWDDQDNGIPWDDEKDAPASTLRDCLLNRMRETIEKLGPLATFCAEAVKKGTV